MDTRERLIELLTCGIPSGDHRGTLAFSARVADVIADHLIDNGVTVQEWIPVEERLPSDGTYITMTDAGGRCQGVIAQEWETVTVRGKTKSRWVLDNRISTWNVTHWMPLPQPPEKEGE